MATTGVVNGTDLLLYADGNAVAYSTTCTLDITIATRETTNKDTGDYSTFAAGRRSGTASVDGLVALDSTYNYSYLFGLMQSGALVWLRYSTNVSTDKYYQVQAVMSSLNLSASDGENTTYSASFNTVGAPQEVELT